MIVRARYVIGPLVLSQLALAIFYINDLALVFTFRDNGGATLPYSPLWFALNPFAQTVHTYLWYLFSWQMAFLGIMLFLLKHKKTTLNAVYWSQITNIVLVLMHNPQSIVPMSFVYLIPALGPFVLIIAGIIKLPIGWSLNLKDTHWSCAFGNSNYVISQFNVPCAHFTQFTNFFIYPSILYNYYVYIMLAIMIIGYLRIWHSLRS